MPSIYDLKPRFQQLLRPLTQALHRAGVTANAVTLTATAASMLYGVLMLYGARWRWPFLFLPLFMFVRMAFNAVDGMLAREHNQQTRAGAILNETGDVISDAALFAPFALLPGVQPALVMTVIFLSTLSEFVGVLAQVVGGTRRYDGPLGKSDRAALFGAIGLAVGLGWPVHLYLNTAFTIATALLCWTGWNRARHAF